jgi:nitrite reductase/ring-hydroxylating ferredoxin subunit
VSDPLVELVDVGALEDFPVGEAKVVRLGKREVAVFNVDGELFACKNLCPHQGDPLHCGPVENGAVMCTGHDWTFDLKTGACVAGYGVVRTYPVRIVDGRVHLER